MNKQFIASLCVLAMVGMAVGVGVQADDTVECTVTPGVVSVTITPDAVVAYGAMAMGDTKSSEEITATAGAVEVDLTIKGSDAVYATDNVWTLGSAPGTDIYTHAYTTDDSWSATGEALTNDPTTGWDALATSAQDLILDLAANDGEIFKLDMRTPSTAGGETIIGEVYSTTVTIMAVSSV